MRAISVGLLLLLTAILVRAQVGFGAVSLREYDSPNGEFKLKLENKAGSPNNDLLTGTMISTRGPNAGVLWSCEFQGEELIRLVSQPIFADDGSFFVIKRFLAYDAPEWLLVAPKVSKRIAVVDRHASSYFNSDETKIIEADKEGSQPIVRVWDRNTLWWTAFSVQDGSEIESTRERRARWNETTRAKILKRIETHRTLALARKLDEISPKLRAVAETMTSPQPSGLRPIDLEFLALQRDERDRAFFARLLNSNERDSKLFGGLFEREFGWDRARESAPRGIFHLEETNPDRLAADRLMAVFEGNARKIFSLATTSTESRMLSSSSLYTTDQEPRRYLGEVEGTVHFSTPFKTPLGTVRIYLIPDETKDWSWRAEVVEQNWGGGRGQIDDSATFAFTTVTPGAYFLKTIWDRRPPQTDTNMAGPGDYESAFAGPFQVKAGQVVTNITLYCTNRASGGEIYYAADDTASRLWNDGELTSRTGDGSELFLAGLGKWVIATNQIAQDRNAWINSVSLLKGGPRRYYEMDAPNLLMINARTESAVGKNELETLVIMDEHGCPFTAHTAFEPGLNQFYFSSFPRSSPAFRVIGKGADQKSLFDLTLTNLVRTAKMEMKATPLPLELDLGQVKLKVNEVRRQRPEKWTAGVAAQFFENGVISTNWALLPCRFADSEGNSTEPDEFCREEKVVRIQGHVLRKVKRTREETARSMLQPNASAILSNALPFEIVISRGAIENADQ